MRTPADRKPGDRLAGVSRPGRRAGRWLGGGAVGLGVAVWLASGLYFVQPGERAVVRRWGRVVEPSGGPGLGWSWPRPIGRVDKPRTAEVKRVSVGLDEESRRAIAGDELQARIASPATDVFTGDVNIVKPGMIAQYQISRPERYVTATAEPDRLVRRVVQSVMVEALGGMDVDYALTAGKVELQNRCRDQAQRMLDGYDCGITLVSVDLQGIEPPYAISDAFKDVASAKKDREKAIDQAHAYAGSVLPKARGRAAELLAAAEGYRAQRVSAARGEADRFLSVHREYAKAPKVTRTRLLLAALGEVVSRAEVYVLTPNDGGEPLRVTIYDRGRKGE